MLAKPRNRDDQNQAHYSQRDEYHDRVGNEHVNGQPREQVKWSRRINPHAHECRNRFLTGAE